MRAANSSEISFFSNALLEGSDRHNPKKIAGLFEAIFYRCMLKNAHEESSEDPVFGSFEMSHVQGMFDDELSTHMGMAGHLGIADLVLENMEQMQAALPVSSFTESNVVAGLIKPPSNP